MKFPLSATAAVIAAGYLFNATSQAGGILAADYDAGQTAGSSVVGATAVIPTTNTATTSVTVVTGTANLAGGGAGNGFRMVDNGGSAAAVEYNFVPNAAGQISSFRADFDLARVTAGPAASTMVFGCGEYNTSTSVRMNSSSQRFLTVEFTGDGKVSFISATGADSYNNVLLGGKNHVTVFVNDRDSQSVTYARPDNGQNEALAANSAAFWLNSALLLTTTLDTADTTANGTVGTSENNFGRAGFSTFSTVTGMDWNIDNVCVSELVTASSGTKYFVSDAAGFNALPALNAGDTVILRNGAYGQLNKTLVSNISSDATAQSNPVMVRAETPGGADMNAPSQITLQGRGIVLAGLDFLSGSGMIDNGDDDPAMIVYSATNSRYMRISNVRFLNCVTGDNYGHWILLQGFQHVVEYCSFEGKNEPNRNATVAFKRSTSEAGITTPRNHALRYCYFGPRECSNSSDPDIGNGYETIRIGDSASQAHDMHVTVEQNVFYHSIWRNDADDPNDIEIISSKSKGNQILNNTFLESRGQITLRHGDGCTIDGNFVIGGGYYSGTSILMNSTADGFQSGIRIIGQDHTIRNNYLINLRGVNLRAALCLMSGSAAFYDGNGSGGESGYEPAHNAQIYNNTFIDCYQLNLGYVKSGTTLPAGVNVYNNAWQGNSTSYGIKAATGFTVAGSGGNYIFQQSGTFGWNGLSGGVYTSSVSPDITEAFDNYRIPTATSPLLGNAATTLVAAKDVRGLNRPAAGKDIGCFEREIAGSGRRPLLRNEVGPIFYGGPKGTYP